MATKKKTTTKGKKTNQEDILIDMMKSYPLLRTDTDIFAKITRNGKACNLSLNSEEFLFFIKSEFKELTGSFPISTTMKDCIDYIKNLAYKNEVTEARYRIAPYEDSIRLSSGIKDEKHRFRYFSIESGEWYNCVKRYFNDLATRKAGGD